MSTVHAYTNSEFHPVLNKDVAEVFLVAADLIGKSLEPEQAIGGILQLLADRLRLDKGRVVLQDKDSGVLRIRYAYGLSEEEQARGTYVLGEGVTGRVMVEGSIALVPDISKEPEYLARVFSKARMDSNEIAFIAVPIIQDERPIGVLAVTSMQVRSIHLKCLGPDANRGRHIGRGLDKAKRLFITPST